MNLPPRCGWPTSVCPATTFPKRSPRSAGLWKRTAGTDPDPPVLFFLDELVQSHYLTMLRQAQAFGIGAGISVLLACVGLFALTAATAERCIREIGIRKALGADTTTIVRLLLWQFVRPVFWALLIAWPVSYWVMNRWLAGFAYHTTIPWWIVPVTTGAALTIATSTVITQALRFGAHASGRGSALRMNCSLSSTVGMPATYP